MSSPDNVRIVDSQSNQNPNSNYNTRYNINQQRTESIINNEGSRFSSNSQSHGPSIDFSQGGRRFQTTSSQTTSSQVSQANDNKSNSSGGAIAGIIIAVLIVAAMGYGIYKYRSKNIANNNVA